LPEVKSWLNDQIFIFKSSRTYSKSRFGELDTSVFSSFSLLRCMSLHVCASAFENATHSPLRSEILKVSKIWNQICYKAYLNCPSVEEHFHASIPKNLRISTNV